MGKFNPLTKISECRVKLYPEKYDASYNFYKNTLSFPIVKEWNQDPEDKGAMFDTGTAIIELLYEGSPEKIRGCDLSLEVKDVRKLFEKIKNEVKIVFSLRHNDWGDTSFCVTDPNGFELTFFTKD